MKIQCPISQHALQCGDSPALILPEAVYSYRNTHRLVSAVACYLSSIGIHKGTRVALRGRNSMEFIVSMAALWRLGAIAVPLSFRFPGDYIAATLERLRIAFCLWNEKEPLTVGSSCSLISFQEIRRRMPSAQEAQDPAASLPMISIPNEATIILTSGSTAEGKAVLHTYANHYYNALGSNQNIILTKNHRWLLSLPLFHVGGLGILFRCFLAGAAVVVPDTPIPLAESLVRFKITHASLVSTQLRQLLEAENGGRFHLKALLLGGSAFPSALITQGLRDGLPLFTSYGLSEAASQVTTTAPGDLPGPTSNQPRLGKLATSGKALMYRRVKTDKNNNILVRGKTLFKGYISHDKLHRPFDDDGWFRTGDLGRIDADGYLKVIGRKDNMFISGGENIIPEEIEDLLAQVPGIRRAVVLPMEDQTFDRRPAAFLDIDTGSGFNIDWLRHFLAQKLPKFKIPDIFYHWPVHYRETGLKINRGSFKTYLETPATLKPIA